MYGWVIWPHEVSTTVPANCVCWCQSSDHGNTPPTHMVPPTLPKVGQLRLQCVLEKLKPCTDDGEQPDISDDEGLLSEGEGGEGRERGRGG